MHIPLRQIIPVLQKRFQSHRIRHNRILTLLLLVVLSIPTPARAESGKWVFSLQSDSRIHHQPFTGRVYLFFDAENGNSDPRFGPNWFHPQPFISLDVKDWQPEAALLIDFNSPNLRKFPSNLDSSKLQGMRAQAVVRFNPWVRKVGQGEGNGFSDTQTLQAPGTATFLVNHVVPRKEFPESDWCKLLRIRSQLVSTFHQRDTDLQAAVTLPASYYQDPNRRYPVIFEVPGFGGTHLLGVHRKPVSEKNDQGVEFIRVMLDPSCPLGHHVFANSASNGPYLDALVQEFLPALDATYRTIPNPGARFLTGHSSGGWSTLWIQINAAKHFGGTWSTSPDPVDFRDFQQINLYRRGENMFHDEQGHPRPLARVHGRPIVFYETFSNMEDVLGHGGQLRSFEAVFSPRRSDGLPALLWNRQTGAIDHEIAEAWRKYDIRLLLVENWEKLKPELRGKLHVFMGTEDTFYLEGATQLLKQSLQQLGSDAEVELIPGRDHMNLFAGGLHTRIEQAMAKQFVANQFQNLQKQPESTNLK